MMQSLETFFGSLHGVWGYAFLLVSAFVENIFPPMPGDTFVVLGAVLESLVYPFVGVVGRSSGGFGLSRNVSRTS